MTFHFKSKAQEDKFDDWVSKLFAWMFVTGIGLFIYIASHS